VSDNTKRWRAVKVDDETYSLLKQLAALLDLKHYEAVKVAVMMMFILISSNEDVKRRAEELIISKVEKRKKRVESVLASLTETLS